MLLVELSGKLFNPMHIVSVSPRQESGSYVTTIARENDANEVYFVEESVEEIKGKCDEVMYPIFNPEIPVQPEPLEFKPHASYSVDTSKITEAELVNFLNKIKNHITEGKSMRIECR